MRYNKIMKTLADMDTTIIGTFRRFSLPAARLALFIIFFWFGILKLAGVSPAENLVQSLFERTIPFISFHIFYEAFSIFECAIGILFLIPRTTRVVIPFLAIHMTTTVLPLIFLPSITWQNFLVPTLEGQYIIKNVAIVALAMIVAADLEPLSKRQTS
jgi:uncharacterized membrane protein YkgB